MNSLKIAMLLKSYYSDQDDDFIANAAHELSQRKALTINHSTGEIAVFDAAAVREIAPKLLSPLRGSPLTAPTQQAIPDDADFDTKLAMAAENFRRLGLPTSIGGGDNTLPFTMADLAKLGGAQ